MSREILKPLADWDYANLTKNASERGGVKQFVSNIYDTGKQDGFVVGVTGTLMVVALVYGGKQAYKKYKDWDNKRKIELTDKLLERVQE